MNFFFAHQLVRYLLHFREGHLFPSPLS
jgi:hypothetical protein